MSNIEPTEEQLAAVRAIAEKEGARVQLWHLDEIARLLAKREAKLRDQIDKLVANTVHRDWLEACSERDRAKAIAKEALDQRDTLRAELHTEKLVAEKALAARNEMENERDAARRDLKQSKAMSEAARDTLRARVAELEKERDDMDARAGMYSMHLDEAMKRVAELEASEPNVLLQRAYSLACNERNAAKEREAQHLADIKALEALLAQYRERAHPADIHEIEMPDDAKAAKGGEG